MHTDVNMMAYINWELVFMLDFAMHYFTNINFTYHNYKYDSILYHIFLITLQYIISCLGGAICRTWVRFRITIVGIYKDHFSWHNVLYEIIDKFIITKLNDYILYVSVVKVYLLIVSIEYYTEQIKMIILLINIGYVNKR